MAQSENAIPNGTHFMDVTCSTSNQGTETNLEATMSETKDTVNDANDESPHPNEDFSHVEDKMSSCVSGNSCAPNDVQCQSDNVFPNSSEEQKDNDKFKQKESEAGIVDGQFQESNNDTGIVGVTADCDISINAVSLADIRASFVNNEEVGDGDCKTKDTRIGSSEVIDIDNLTKNNTVYSNTSVGPNLLHDGNTTTAISDPSTVSGWTTSNNDDCSKPNDNSALDCETDNMEKKTISSYEIQPGELTNQLIEGPSITLPLSEISNRNSSAAASNELCASASLKPDNIEKDSLPSTSDSVAVEVTNEQSPSTTQTQAIASFSSISPSPSGSATDTCSNTCEQMSFGSLRSDATTITTPTSTSSISSSISSSTTSAPAPAKRIKKTPDDFIFGKVLGEGSYSSVYLAKEVSSQREFAVKVCEKKHLIREKKTHFVMREKEVLMKLDHPFFIRLAYTFQDSERLYYVLTYARNGELLSYLNKLSVFDVPCTRFYSAEVVIALEYLQGLGIVHRDLKPENILLGEDMHIKISDFGTSKFINGRPQENKQSKRKNSFVGTAEYVSPEVLNGQPANYGTDLWALACIIYQCLSSCLPFRSGNEYQTFQKILKLEYEFPEGFHDDAKDLVQRLLVLEPTERLGMKEPGGMEELKQHPFFQGIEWATTPTTTPPKLLPYLPASANNPEFWGEQEQRTGFDDQRLAEIITGQSERSTSPELEPVSMKRENVSADVEQREKLDKQRQENQFHQFVSNNLILRQGFVDKRKGFFARKRMLLLTEGPHLYYVDAHNKVLKGEIPWSEELRTEAKNFKIFFVHTPNRTYYLESRNPDAHHWVKRIQDVWNKYYGNEDEKGCKKES